jgi:hypothetical protein
MPMPGVNRPETQCQYMRLFSRCNMRDLCAAMQYLSERHFCGTAFGKSLVAGEKMSDSHAAISIG